jgi:hypothetical protein
MALIKCPECGHEISDQAESCPNCGLPQNNCLNEVALQTELNRIDLQWQKDREKHVMYGPFGGRGFPKRGTFWWKYILFVTAIFPLLIFMRIKGVTLLDILGAISFWSLLVLFFWTLAYSCFVEDKIEKYEQAEKRYIHNRVTAISEAGHRAKNPIDELESTDWKEG